MAHAHPAVPAPLRSRRGPILLTAGALTAAVTTVCTLVMAAPAWADAADDIADLFESSFANEATGDTDRALNDTIKILRVDPDHYVATLRAGWLYYSKGRYGDAIDFYGKASKLAPKAIEPRLGIMLPMMAAERWGEARKIGEGILKAAPRNYLATSRLAFIAYSQGRFKDAENLYKDVLTDYPSDVDMMLGLGWTYVKQGRRPEAKAMFSAVLAIRKSNTSARAGLDAI